MPDKNSNESVKKKRKYLLFKILAVFLFVLTILYISLLYFSTDIFKSYIQKSYKKSTKGVYEITFDDLKINIAKGEIIFTNLKIIPHKNIYDKLKKLNLIHQALYKISIKKINIGIIELSTFTKESFLSIKRIYIDKPKLSILEVPENNNTDNIKYDAIHKDLYPAVSKYFKTLQIKKIVLKDGYFDLFVGKKYKGHKAKISTIDITLENFKVNEDIYHTNKKIFYSDRIIFKTYDYFIELKDKIHNLYAESISIDTRDSSIIAENVKLNYRLYKTLRNKDIDLMYYTMPLLKISGCDFNRAYFDKELIISNIQFVSPKLLLIPGENKNTEILNDSANVDFSFKQINLYNFIDGFFKWAKINSFALKNASLKVFKNRNKNIVNLDIKNLDINFYDFFLDKDAVNNVNRIFYSSGFDVRMAGFKLLLKNKHVLRSAYLFVSSKKGIISANNIKIYPVNQSDSSAALHHDKLYFLNANKLSVTGLNFRKAYNFNIISLNRFEIANTKFVLKNFVDKISIKKHKKLKHILKSFGAIINNISTRDFVLRNVDFEYYVFSEDKTENQKITANITLNIKNFVTDKYFYSDSGKVFFADDLVGRISNIAIKIKGKPNRFLIDTLFLSTITDRISLAGFRMIPEDTSIVKFYNIYDKKDFTDLYVRDIDMTGVDIMKTYFSDTLNIENIVMNEPLIKYTKYKDVNIDDSISKTDKIKLLIKKIIPKTLIVTKIKDIRINNGFIKYHENDSLDLITNNFDSYFDAYVSDFYCDKNEDSVDVYKLYVYLTDFHYYLPDNIHYIDGNNAYIDITDSLLDISYLKLKKLKNAIFLNNVKKYNNALVKTIIIRGLDYKRLINKKDIIADTLFADKLSFISVLWGKNNRKTKKTATKGDIDIGFVQIKNGKWGKFLKNKKIDDFDAKVDFDLTANNLFIADSSKMTDFFWDKPELILKDLYFKTADSLYLIRFDSLYYDSKHTFLTNVSVKPLSFLSDKNTIIELNIPVFKSDYFDIRRLINDKILETDVIYTDSVSFVINQMKESEKKTKLADFDLYPISKKILKKIKVDSLLFDNFKLVVNQKYNNKRVEIPLMSGYLKRLIIDSVKRSNTILNSENLVASIDSFNYKMKDSVYLVHTGEIWTSVKDSVIVVNDLLYEPKYDIYKFQDNFKINKTAISFICDSIILDKVDVLKIYDDKYINSKKAFVKDFSLSAYSNDKGIDDTLSKGIRLRDFLLNLNVKMKIDTVELDNAYIQYIKDKKESVYPAYITIEKIYGNIYNLTNDTSVLQQNDTLKILFDSYLQGKGFLSGEFDYYLLSPSGDYVYFASMDTMDLRHFNPLLENMLFVKLKKGTLTYASFVVTADSSEAEGSMILKYNDLKISVLKKDSAKQRRAFTSWIANSLLPSSNPKHKFGMVKEGYIYYRAPIYSSVFSYWIQAILSGIKSTFGFETKDMKAHKKLKRKIDRLTRKEYRKKQRQQKKLERKLKKHNNKKQK